MTATYRSGKITYSRKLINCLWRPCRIKFATKLIGSIEKYNRYYYNKHIVYYFKLLIMIGEEDTSKTARDY